MATTAWHNVVVIRTSLESQWRHHKLVSVLYDLPRVPSPSSCGWVLTADGFQYYRLRAAPFHLVLGSKSAIGRHWCFHWNVAAVDKISQHSVRSRFCRTHSRTRITELYSTSTKTLRTLCTANNNESLLSDLCFTIRHMNSRYHSTSKCTHVSYIHS